MSTFKLNIEVDPVSLVEFSRVQNAGMFQSSVQQALERSSVVLETTATGFMWDHFQNPTGELENSWVTGVLDWNQAYLDNTADYARRRNFGFSGHTDALGRFYPVDEGIAWAENSIEMATPEIEGIFDEELNVLWR
jgi:hypothetical protein